MSPLLIVAVAMMLAPTAGAVVVQTTTLEISGQTQFALAPDFMHVEGAGQIDLSGSGHLVRGDYYQTRQYQTTVAEQTPIVFDPTQCNHEAATAAVLAEQVYQCTDHETLAAGDLSSLRIQPSAGKYVMRVFQLDSNPQMVGVLDSVTGLLVDDEVIAHGGKVPQPAEPKGSSDFTGEDPDPNDPYFTAREMSGPTILLDAIPSRESLDLEGDFILEIWGLDATVEHASGPTTTYQTGTTRDEAVPLTGVNEEVFSLLRIHFEGAKVSLKIGAGTVVQLVSSAVSLASEEAALHIDGSALAAEIGEILEDGSVLVPAPYSATFGAERTGMAGEVQTQGSTVAPAAGGGTYDGLMGKIWLLVGAAFIAITAFWFIRQHRVPPIPKIEQALEAGAYKKAARLSGRIIRRDPRQESAQLTRAIAWSRIGQHQRIVRHLGSFLGQHEPQDGTLHYVLGLAYADAGMRTEARAAMAAAVARTPSLIADVDPELRPTASAFDGAAYS